MRLIGLPHLGFRGRARLIIREALRASEAHTRILDAGCGYGIYSLTLAEKGRRNIDSIDLDPMRIQALGHMVAEHPDLMGHIRLQAASVTSLPFPDKSFDLAICSEVIEHVADHAMAASELSRVMKPGGTLIISVPYNSKHNQKIFRKFGHERPGYTRSELSQLFAPYGVTIGKDSHYEYWLGTFLFDAFNLITWKPLMGILFYPFYFLYRLDALLSIGQPNGIVVVGKKM